MKLRNFLVPKWRHSDPVIRLKAVREIDNENLEILENVLFHDEAPDVRLEALKKINSELILEKIIQKDSDQSLQEVAISKLNQIRVKKIFSTEDQNDQMVLLNSINDDNILLSIFKKIESPEIRAVIVEKASDSQLLCKMTESNCGIKAGNLIINKISDEGLLKQIAKKASNKKIRRRAAEKITPDTEKTTEKIISEKSNTNIAEKLEKICTSIESSLPSNDYQLIEKTLSETAASWKQYSEGQISSFSDRYRTGIEKLESKKIRLERTETTIQTLQNLCSTAKEISEDSSINEKLLQKANDLEKEWEISKSGLNNFTIYNSLYSELTQHISLIHEKYNQFLAQVEKEAAALENLQVIVNSVEDFLKQDLNSMDEETILTFETKWNAVYFDSKASNILTEKFNQAIQTIKEKIDEKNKLQNQEQAEKVNILLTVVKDASEEDEKNLLKIATRVKGAATDWKDLDDFIDTTKENEFKTYCDLFYDRLDTHKKNREWELWANLSLKKELCEKAEKTASIVETTDEISGYSQIIREAQSQWKEIGPVTKEHSDAIWKTFKSACDRVYSKCLNEKKKLFEETQQALESDNFNETSATIIVIQEKWNKIGALPLAIEKDLRDSFKELCDTFFLEKRDFIKQKNKDREDNYIKKVSLCDEAEVLLESSPHGKTTENFKRLQSDWKKTGPVPRDRSDEVWNRFKLACDTYFTKLEETKPENLKIKIGFCEEAEAILQSTTNGSDIREACNSIIIIQKNWKGIGPVPQEHSEPVWQRFRISCDKIFQLREETEKTLSIDQDKNRELKENLIKQACKIVEQADSKSVADELKELQKKWREAGAAPRKEEQGLWLRFREVNDSFFNKRREDFQIREEERKKNLQTKEELCLTLELLAKIISDNSDTAYDEQVPLAEQLSKARELRDTYHVPGDEKTTRANIMKKVKDIQSEWKATGSVGSEKENLLWERYKKAGDLFYS